MPLLTMKLSAIEQSSRLRTLYTQLCFCFAASNDDIQARVVERLRQGLTVLTESLPWLAGQVIEQDGNYKIAPLRGLPGLTVKDLTSDASFPTMQELREAGYPFSMLDEKTICPRNTLSDGPGEDENQPYPVMLLQVNFIQGGILLAILACHSTLDIVGEALMIRLLSQACHGTHFAEEVIANCNLDRQNIIPLLDIEEGKSNEPNSAPKPTSDVVSSPKLATPVAPKLEWAYFKFGKQALVELKKYVTSTLPDSTPFVSTDDCICTVLWQSLARVRLARLDTEARITFSRQVNVRKYMDIPDTYPGNVVSAVADSLSLVELTSSFLGDIAAKLREHLDPQVLVYILRATATEAKRQSEKSQSSGGREKKRDRENTITMSSWSKVSCHDVDFNLGLGPPVAVRRPKFTPIEGVVYLLPKGSDGDILAALCLREEDMIGLRKDIEFCRWAEYIG